MLPHTLSLYTQFLLNIFAVLFIMYIGWSFWATIRSDVDKKSEEAAAETLAEMAVCAREYVANRCERDLRVPAMEAVCNNWEKCMNRDPGSVGRARVSAHTFAEIVNSFIEPISIKAMVSPLPTCSSLSFDVYGILMLMWLLGRLFALFSFSAACSSRISLLGSSDTRPTQTLLHLLLIRLLQCSIRCSSTRWDSKMGSSTLRRISIGLGSLGWGLGWSSRGGRVRLKGLGIVDWLWELDMLYS